MRDGSVHRQAFRESGKEDPVRIGDRAGEHRRRRHWGARHRLAVIAVSLGALALLLAAPSAAFAAGGTVQVGAGNCLNEREGPSNIYPSRGCLGDGTPVNIVCQIEGETIDGNWGPTDLWDRIDDPLNGPFLSDGFVNTGTNGPVAPPCP
jgi:hypothetical protein